MHPFSLNQETAKEVTGGVTENKAVTTGLLESGDDPYEATTMALGEEGGLPIDLTW